MVMAVTTVAYAKEVPWAPEAGVGVAMTVRPVVVSLLITYEKSAAGQGVRTLVE
jgi:hypothetical protein